jgi:hypothetical protein
MGIFFDDPKPKLSKEEFQKAKNALSSYGFSEKEIDFVEGLFASDLHGTRDSNKGIQMEEIENNIKWLRSNLSSHALSKDQIVILERELKERL